MMLFTAVIKRAMKRVEYLLPQPRTSNAVLLPVGAN